MFPINQPSLQNFPTTRAHRAEPLPAVPQNPEEGSLVIIDGFHDSLTQAAHGNVAAHAAEQHGFRGTIYAEQIGPDEGRLSTAHALNTSLSAARLPNDAARTAVDQMFQHGQAELLDDVTGDLNKIRERGLSNSAVNISYGTHPERQAEQTYRRVRSAPASQAQANMSHYGQQEYNFAQNIMGAFEIDPTKLNSSDPEVSGPERLRLQQALIDSAQRGRDSDQVAQAKQKYDQAVVDIEKNNNSVVVSSGNDQEVLDNFAKDANGLKVKTSENSGLNILINNTVTTVGATRWSDSKTERLAEYSSRNSEVDIYASGSVGAGSDQNRMTDLGTSFSAPRVAAALANLHGTRPGTPSHAAEKLMLQSLTHTVEDQPVLDFEKTEEFLRTNLF